MEKKLSNNFDVYKSKYNKKTQNKVYKEIVLSLAIALLDPDSFKAKLNKLHDKITLEDIDELQNESLINICKTLSRKYKLCTSPREVPLWALAFWAAKKEWLDEDYEN